MFLSVFREDVFTGTCSSLKNDIFGSVAEEGSPPNEPVVAPIRLQCFTD